MNKRPFALTTEAQCVRNVPDDGEMVGEELALAAKAREEHYRAIRGTNATTPVGELNDYSARRVAQLYHLAADAYEIGSSVSIGHSRSARYDEKAKQFRDHALELEGKYCSK